MFVSHIRRGILRSSLGRKPLRASYRAFSGSSGGSGDGKSDLELHRGYEGFMPRFDAARALLFTQEGEEKFEMYVDAKIGGGFISKMLVLTDLEHPLFLKYNFDAREFMKGAKHSFEIITSEVIHSKEFRDYVERSTFMSTSNEMVDTILDREAELESSIELKNKNSSLLEKDIAEDIRKQDLEDKSPGEKSIPIDEAREESPEPLSEEVIRSTAAAATDVEEDGVVGVVEFLRSVCTEEAFQDIVRITNKENLMVDKFIITTEELDSFFLSRAHIRIEEDDRGRIADDESVMEDVIAKSTTSGNGEKLRVIADIKVKFLAMCTLDLPQQNGIDNKKWKMMRVFDWTFSSDINNGRDGLDWKISEVHASGWN